MQSTGQTSTHDSSTQSRQSLVITHAIAFPFSAPATGATRRPALLELRLLVHDVLSNHRVVFLQLQLSRRVLAVLHGRVEVARSGGRLHLDLLALALLRHGLRPRGLRNASTGLA